MFRLPVIRGLIRRRILLNFRVEAEVMRRFLPAPFEPQLQAGWAIAGICLIRLEQIRPSWLPFALGANSENAAHRVAVQWRESDGVLRQGVYIPRRDTNSWVNHLAGGRIFPGVHHLAWFAVQDAAGEIRMQVQARDGGMRVQWHWQEAGSLPTDSVFADLAEASRFFEGGSVGYSSRPQCEVCDGLELRTHGWAMRPVAVEAVDTSFFADEAVFPRGSVTFDHALVMRDLEHQWHELKPLAVSARATA